MLDISLRPYNYDGLCSVYGLVIYTTYELSGIRTRRLTGLPSFGISSHFSIISIVLICLVLVIGDC